MGKRVGAVLLAAALVAACSSDREGEDVAASAPEAAASPAAAEVEAFGDLPTPCGEGDAAGATDQGVTDDAIRIGYGDDAGFPGTPGIGKYMSETVRAFVRWCNDQGGINGRPIEATYYDAKITEVNNVFLKACEQEFMMVGQGFTLDSAQEETRRGCGLPTVPAFAASPQHTNAPMKFETLPASVDRVIVAHGALLKELHPDTIDKAGVLYVNYAAAIDNKEKVKAGFGQALGYDFACEVAFGVQGEPDWRPVIQRLKECGAEIVYFVGSVAPHFQNALEAADQLEFEPIWFGDPNMYDAVFAEWNTRGLADRVYFRSAMVPLFEADQNEATRQYIDIVEADGGTPALLGQQAAGSFLLWATAAKACGSDLTRECVLDELAGIHEWDAGGLQAEVDPGRNEPPRCAALLRLDGTGFARVLPEEPGTFACDESYVLPLTEGPVLEAAKLDANRISQL